MNWIRGSGCWKIPTWNREDNDRASCWYVKLKPVRKPLTIQKQLEPHNVTASPLKVNSVRNDLGLRFLV